MKRLLLTYLTMALLLGGSIPAASAVQPSPKPQEPPTEIYKISGDGRAIKAVGQMPAMHRAAISPSGRYVYGEKIGFSKQDATVPYLYNLQTKKLVKLPGFAKWSPRKDLLYMLENEQLVLFEPATGQKKVLVHASAAYPITDFLVAPDEEYLAFIRKDLKGTDEQVRYHLYLQHVPTLKMKINDRFAMTPSYSRDVQSLYWMPTSRKLFYKTNAAYKELDLPTGLKYEHKLSAFPSYSSDMKYKYVRTQNEEYFLDLQTGKKVMQQKQSHLPIMEQFIDKIVWSPKGHAFAAEWFFRPSNAQDSYMMIRYQKEPSSFLYPFGGIGENKWSPYLSAIDNIRVIGWSQDGKSVYVADLASMYYSAFSPDKLNEYRHVVEQ
ncbi:MULTISPECIES: hypothetical protein [Brevibacillus]|jgi:hypothetical protein|uniref:hypothetical protein n=1 Tax=Brevibacillus TaxID=55080 RepID=UPI001FAA6829|nr:hypothetical protein [Brevibacillus borstelensis]MED1874507.1 hypothetical protein [Brevibacillus borstelensis]WNF04046.1 hypothetical protein RFB14_16720 [Brevibacillus borstelensis]